MEDLLKSWKVLATGERTKVAALVATGKEVLRGFVRKAVKPTNVLRPAIRRVSGSPIARKAVLMGVPAAGIYAANEVSKRRAVVKEQKRLLREKGIEPTPGSFRLLPPGYRVKPAATPTPSSRTIGRPSKRPATSIKATSPKKDKKPGDLTLNRKGPSERPLLPVDAAALNQRRLDRALRSRV